jgi:hypothetical protein
MHFRDAVLFMIISCVGFITGSATRSWKYIGGGLSALLTVPLTTVREAIEFQLDGMREHGTPLTPPSSVGAPARLWL